MNDIVEINLKIEARPDVRFFTEKDKKGNLVMEIWENGERVDTQVFPPEATHEEIQGAINKKLGLNIVSKMPKGLGVIED